LGNGGHHRHPTLVHSTACWVFEFYNRDLHSHSGLTLRKSQAVPGLLQRPNDRR
jgi:hypothetical protein